MTEQEKQALIVDCKEEIEIIRCRIGRTVATNGSTEYLESRMKRQQIALAPLTAQPVKLPDTCGYEHPEKEEPFYTLNKDEVIATIRAAGYEVEE